MRAHLHHAACTRSSTVNQTGSSLRMFILYMTYMLLDVSPIYLESIRKVEQEITTHADADKEQQAKTKSPRNQHQGPPPETSSMRPSPAYTSADKDPSHHPSSCPNIHLNNSRFPNKPPPPPPPRSSQQTYDTASGRRPPNAPLPSTSLFASPHAMPWTINSIQRCN